MLALVCFTFFACILNHSTWFGLDNTQRVESNVTIPADALTAKDKLAVVEFLRQHGANGAVQPFDWPGEGEPFHIAFKSPRAQCDADITLPGGETHLTVESHRLAGMLARLHTAKDAGAVWRLLLDVTAATLLFVCVSGFVLWQSLPKRRRIGVAALGLSIAAVAAMYWIWVP
jgi:hypothetical protein